MKPSLLILSTESLAEVLHDEHALQNGPRFLDGKDRVCILMWRGKVGKPEHSAECDLWRAIAEKFSEHLMTWLSSSATPSVAAGVSQPSASADADARDHHLTTSAAHVAAGVSQPLKPVEFIQMAGEFRDIHWFNQQLQELQAKLIDRTAEAAQLAERAARLQHELDTTRKHETHLIQERDRLIHQDLKETRQQLEQTKKELFNAHAFIGWQALAKA